MQDFIQHPIFKIISEAADEIQCDCYVIGGYVRDKLLHRSSKDIDIMVVGSGIALAQKVALKWKRHSTLSVFKTFGTAQLKAGSLEIEFVGARRESYNKNSRKPIVEDGTLDDDQKRRDFTINTLAISLSSKTKGELLDPFHGIDDLNQKIIRTPLDPDITFSDDPLRMLRAIRFATQLEFQIESNTFASIKKNCERVNIVSAERIADELNKIMAANHPSIGFKLLDDSGLLSIIFPELIALKGVDTKEGKGHKDNFIHTLAVLDKVGKHTDNLWLRWAALLHDIAKPVTKRWDDHSGWTFHNHNFIGEKMIPTIFKRLKLPMNDKMKFVQKMVSLHMRPIVLSEEGVTDSAIRRLLFDAGDDIESLMTLCEADITSKNQARVKRHLENFQIVRQKLIDIEAKDRLRNWQPPVDGTEIMKLFGLRECREVGWLKNAIKEAILEGIIPNEHEEALHFMIEKAKELNLEPIAAAGKQNGNNE
ncbi:CCA tRNA nucleotidyltransferase [Microbacter margulisiae]|uniref:Poly(A) polymerase n=1 Tax=Microbacter margulisiae TaxID=1350067 RepID=A0A7W5H3G6_9PORP|nr:HD domain-containing protein [Microbacter margulisiae]MBB3188569.1 poly(A) polymerase [Microbacter margulisiae]